jgi:hypothetical protein
VEVKERTTGWQPGASQAECPRIEVRTFFGPKAASAAFPEGLLDRLFTAGDVVRCFLRARFNGLTRVKGLSLMLHHLVGNISAPMARPATDKKTEKNQPGGLKSQIGKRVETR